MTIRHILVATVWFALLFWLARTAAWLLPRSHATPWSDLGFSLATAALLILIAPVGIGFCVRLEFDRDGDDWAIGLGTVSAMAVAVAAIALFVWFGQ